MTDKPRGTFCGRTRREFLWQAGGGFAALPLASMLGNDGFMASQAKAADGVTDFVSPLAPKAPHFAPKAKSVSFLCLYGGSAYALAMTLGIKKDLAQKIITAVLGDHAGLKRWHKSTADKITKGKKTGFAETRDMFGRRRKVFLKGKDDKQVRHESNALLNFPTQSTGSSVTGSAAQMFRRECMKRGIWGLGEGQCVTANLVHDELVVDSCDTIADRANNLLKYCMENCVDLGVPLYSEGGIEKNWAEAK